MDLVDHAGSAGAIPQLAGTVRRYEEALAYISSRLSNGRTEAFNGKARTITRRGYVLHRTSALIALLKLCCSGIELVPTTLRPGSTHETFMRAREAACGTAVYEEMSSRVLTATREVIGILRGGTCGADLEDVGRNRPTRSKYAIVRALCLVAVPPACQRLEDSSEENWSSLQRSPTQERAEAPHRKEEYRAQPRMPTVDPRAERLPVILAASHRCAHVGAW